MTYRALLIGNSVFEADASLNPLNAPVKDVARLHHALVDEQTGLFDENDVQLVTERTSDRLLDELDAFFGGAQRDDLTLLYYSGHGLLDERNQLYLCGRDTRSDRLLRTAVSNTRINEFIAQSRCQRTVILLDCCSSGMFKGGAVGGQLAGPGRYLVSSTRGSALANDAAYATGTSLFTEYLVQGLTGAATDRDGDGYIDLREVYDYVRDQLASTTTQVPHCRFDGDAAVSLAKARTVPKLSRSTSPAPRPDEPSFALSENAISLQDVQPGERLDPESVEVIAFGDAPLDLTVDTADAWVTPRVEANRIVIELRPRLGINRAKLVVRDRNSGSTSVLRAFVSVRPPMSAERRVPPRDDDTTVFGPVTEVTTKGGPTETTVPPRHEPARYEPPRHEPPRQPPPGQPIVGPDGHPGRPRRTRAVLIVVAALVLLAAATAIGAITTSTHRGSASHSPSAPASSAPGPTRSTPAPTPTVPPAKYSAPGGISVVAPSGWRQDDSAGISSVRDYYAPGTTDVNIGTYFRIGVGDKTAPPTMAEEAAKSVDFIVNQSPCTDGVVRAQRTGRFIGTDSADVEFTCTSSHGVPRHGIERLWLNPDGAGMILEVDTAADRWDADGAQALFTRLTASATAV